MGFQAILSEAKHIKKRQCRHSKAKEFETIHTEGWIYIARVASDEPESCP